MNMLKTLAAAALLATGVTGAAHAELVTNGGFETGDFTGWTLANTNFTFVTTGPFDGMTPHSGNYFAALGNVGTDGLVFQNIPTNVGQNYRISFWVASDGRTPNDLTAIFDGTPILFTVQNLAANNWFQVTADRVALTTSSTLQFLERNDPGYLGLDDVSVVAVPEPATLGLLGLGLAGIGLVRRRKAAA